MPTGHSDAWITLNNATTYSPLATTASSMVIWPHWNQKYTTTGTASYTLNNIIWNEWSQTTSTGDGQWIVKDDQVRFDQWTMKQPAPRLEQDKAYYAQIEVERQRREEQFRERAKERLLQDQQVRERAKELLLAHLDARQKRDVLEHNWFEVISDKGRRWRIRTDGHVGNVDLMPKEGDVRDASYCAHAPGILPHADHHLSQKLVLETDEWAFLQVANRHYMRAALYEEFA